MTNDKITAFLITAALAVLTGLGVTALSIQEQAVLATFMALVTGFVAPSLIEWENGWIATHRNAVSAMLAVALGFIQWLVMHQHMNQKLAGVFAGIIVAVAGLFLPSTAHPSRLATER